MVAAGAVDVAAVHSVVLQQQEQMIETRLREDQTHAVSVLELEQLVDQSLGSA